MSLNEFLKSGSNLSSHSIVMSLNLFIRSEYIVPYKISSPLRHKGSPPHLTKGPEHDEWHKNNSIVEDDSIGKKSIMN